MAKKIRIKRKKKWIQGAIQRPGRMIQYCKRKGYKGVTEECLNEAEKSGDKSLVAAARLARRFRSSELQKGKK